MGSWRQVFVCGVPLLVVMLGLTSCSTVPSVTDSITALPHTAGTAAPLIEHASTGQVAEVHAVVRRALTAELAAGDQVANGATRYTVAQQRSMLAAAETPRRAVGIERDLQWAFAHPGPRRIGGRFVVERWQGTQVEGDRAKVFVLGHSAYTPTATNSQRRDNTGQYQVLLVHSSDGWHVDDVNTVLLESG